MLIGLTGAAGAGKGSVAARLVERHGFREIAFADPLYSAVSAIVALPVQTLKDRTVKEQPIPWVGKSPRELLQLLGTEFGRRMVKDSIWIDLAMRLVDGRTVISDVRFDNEAQAIRDRGGVIWSVTRRAYSCLAGEAADHESEAGIDPLMIGRFISNDGDLAALYAEVDTAVREAT